MDRELITSKIVTKDKISALRNLMTDIYEKYRDYDFESEYTKIKNSDCKYEYSLGGEMSEFGIYAPEKFTESITANCTVGRKTLHPEKGFSFRYYFQNDKIILYEEFCHTGNPTGLKFAYFDGNVETIIYLSTRNMYQLSPLRFNLLYRYEYDENGRVVHGLIGGPLAGSIQQIKELIFNYFDGDKYEVTRYVYTDLMGWKRKQPELPMDVVGVHYTMIGKKMVEAYEIPLNTDKM